MRTGPVKAVLKMREVMRVSQECHIFKQTAHHPVDKRSAAHILPVSDEEEAVLTLEQIWEK